MLYTTSHTVWYRASALSQIKIHLQVLDPIYPEFDSRILIKYVRAWLPWLMFRPGYRESL